MSKIQMGVIFGSRSCEREVAIISALQLMNAVNTEKYDVIPVYIDERGIWYTGASLRKIETYQKFGEAKDLIRVSLDMASGSGVLITYKPAKGLFGHESREIAARLEVCVIVMHGLHGEDGTLQGMLELANLPYTSVGVAGSAIGMDKIMMKQFFRGAGTVPVLPDCWFTRTVYEKDPDAACRKVEGELGYPVFVKPANLGSSIGVSRADDREQLKDALSLAFEYDRRVLVEKGLDHPMELNCSVMGYDDDVTASPIEMPVSGGEMLDFWEKYLQQGGSKGMASLHRILPAPIPEELRDQIQQISKDVFRMMDCKGVVRIDYMFDLKSEKLFITEINTIPGSLAFYLWENAGIHYSELIDRMVKWAMECHEEKNSRNYAYRSDILGSVRLGGAKGSKGAGLKGGAKR